MKRRFFMLALALSLVALLPGINLAQGNGNHDSFLFVAGEEGIVEGPDVATAPDGSTVTLSGDGAFKAGPNQSASGGGEYTVTDPAGNVVASGDWTVTGVLGFVDYGDATPQGLPAFLHGGQLKLAVTLEGYDSGVLKVSCVLGKFPLGKEEGINLVLGQGGNFTKSTDGQTVFIVP